MEKEFCTYEQSLALKELGFDEKCLSRYCIHTEWELPTGHITIQDLDCLITDRNLIKAPLIQQAFRFFREKYELSYSIIHKQSGQRFESVVYSLYDPTMNHIDGVKTYEEAEQACLDKLIELAKEGE